MISKFRAWHTPFTDNKFGQEMKYGRAGTLLSFAEMSPNDYILMQSTGLKDLNGVEIFEGDIVSVRNHPFQKTESSVGIEIDGDYKVSWNEYDLTWCAGNLLLARIKPYVTVIGNIHENPELLEGTE